MDHDHMPSSTNDSTMQHNIMMHMTFFWGKNTEVLFSGWPGTRSGMYVFALIIVFLLSMLIEWLSHSRIIKQSSSRSHVFAGLVQTFIHTIRVGLSYLVMLAVMSFNGGIFLMVIAGHLVGFLAFGSRVFNHDVVGQDEKQRDLPPMTC
ncbi:hypothetical protein AQUCO_02800281v1 [Aquilegia coerulea]|uniref:Copper transport protein n=1 Tax=Aquilegia coerulea TaxID=218851 RepID=A0A2G5D4M0_AQUCA|nr:hypothetical protein AQUCO_02800281v1 [Aquilegia coerulea]